MKRTVFICQPFGIGDILFIQKIILHFAEIGYHVVVPIIDTLAWIRYYLRPHPDVDYPIINRNGGKWTGDFKFADLYVQLYAGAFFEMDNPIYNVPVVYKDADPEEGFIFFALNTSGDRLKSKLMPAKYEFAGLDYSGWADYVHLKRRSAVERELYYDVLGLKDDSRYTLVNQHSSRSALPLSVPGNVVHLYKQDGFTLFDWSLVIERAAQIVTIDTSLVLLAEILKQKKPLYMISRYNPPSFDEVKDILKLDWTLVPTPADLRVSPVT